MTILTNVLNVNQDDLNGLARIIPSRTILAAAYIRGLVKKYNGLANILSHFLISLVSALLEQPLLPLQPLSCSRQAQSN